MKTLCGTIFVATVAVAAFGNDLSSTAMTMNPSDPCRFVDPFVGTSGTGHTFPAACVPFGLVQAGPDTGNCNWDHCSGYRFDDTEIFGFSQTHLNGTGCPDLGDVRILPFVGSDVPASMSFEKASEHASPGRYSVTLAGGVKVDVSATERCAIYRILYPAGEPSRLLVDPRWCITSSYYTRKGPISSRILSADVALDGKTGVSGKVVVSNWVVRAYAFKLEFNRPFVSERDFVFEFASSGEPLIVKVALSALGGVADAEHNLAAEIPDWDFDRIASAANEKWKKALSCVAVEGSDDQKRNFYTSLYHLFIQPNDLSDVGQTPFYSTFSTWDTFRAAHPLYTILVPERVPVMIDSMLKQGKMTGFLPIWTLWGKDNQCMIGTHSVPVIVDWFLKENPVNPVNPVKREFWLSAFAQIKDTLTKPHEGRYKERWDLLATYGYYPFDIIKGESVSRTLECAYDDWCAGKMAERLGLTDDAAFFFKRSGNWRNVFDPSVGFARGKDSEGRWREPFDPFSLGYDEKSDFTEGNAFQYTWHVMQDPDGLVEALGGRDAFVKRLDGLFEQKGSGAESSVVRDVTGLIGQYVHGNEPSHHVIYFYTLVGERDKTARRVRDVFNKFYLPKPDGLCGNDDCGQMSAWYVFSALGFYPFNPCGGTYVLGAPQIQKAAIRLADGKTLTVVAKNLSAENKYVKSVTLNGKPLDKTIEHADIMAGGELVFEMTSGSAGALVLSFDDRNLADWERALPLFDKYGAHATFFFMGPVDASAATVLKKLRDHGHSIGLHGQKHQNADQAVAEMGPVRYFAEEIEPQLAGCRAAGIQVTSFAYPNCRRTDETDALFRAKGFTHIRGGHKGVAPYDPKGEKQAGLQPLHAVDRIFFPASERKNQFRLDTVIAGEAYHTDIEDVLACIRRCAERNEVFVLTSHGIAPDAKHINMKTEWLERILATAKECGVPCLGFDEL